MLVISSTLSSEILEELLEKAHPGVRHVHVHVKPSVLLLAEILSAFPQVEKISCPPSWYTRVPERVKKALKAVSVELAPLRAGSKRSPTKYTKDVLNRILTLRKQGISITTIARELGIPRSTVSNHLKRNRKKLLRIRAPDPNPQREKRKSRRALLHKKFSSKKKGRRSYSFQQREATL